MEAVGVFIALAGLMTIGVWGFKYVSFKLNKRMELTQSEHGLGFIGLGILCLGLLVSNPTLHTFGEILVSLGVILLITSLVHIIRNKFVTKKPVKQVFKQMGVAAVAVMLVGGAFDSPDEQSGHKEREVAAKVDKDNKDNKDKLNEERKDATEKAESEEKIASEKKAKEASVTKAKAESQAKEESIEKKKQTDKKKKDAEAKAKSELADKKRAEEESRLKEQEKAESEKQVQIVAKEQAERKAIAEQEKAQIQAAAAQRKMEQSPVSVPENPVNNIGGVIVGNVRSGIYHMPGQQNYRMSEENKVYFDSEQDAIDAGYRRSKR